MANVLIFFVNPPIGAIFYDHSPPKHPVTLFVNCCLMQPRPEYFDLVCSVFSSSKYLLNPGRHEKLLILAPTELRKLAPKKGVTMPKITVQRLKLV